jgi:glycosyltransferase involved in cell wall biosynthesis
VTEQRITVVMPTYNRASYIAEALDSLAAQTRPPFEVVVVDDRSTDNTRDIVSSHVSKPRYLVQDLNAGASIARNRGVAVARGELIVFLDSDDILLPGHHECVQEAFCMLPDIGLFACDSEMIGPRGEQLHEETWTTIQSRIKSYPIRTGRRSLEDVFLFSTPFPGMAIRRDVYLSVGGLDQSIFPLDDYDLQLKVAARGPGVYYEHRPLARYRVHGANESGPQRAIRVGEMKLRCLARTRNAFRALDALGPLARRRIGDARRELGIALLRSGALGRGSASLARSLAEDPGGWRDLVAIAQRKLRRSPSRLP